MVKGFATQEGTAVYRDRFPGKRDAGHFRLSQGLFFSSLGIGSYLGGLDDDSDALYEESLRCAVLSGGNVIDSAVNYRAQRSERAFGRAIRSLINEGTVNREELIVCTKGGFLPFDSDYPKDAEIYFQETYLKQGLLKAEEIAQGCHAMTPAFLEDQLAKSLQNLGLETLDIYYLHNPETQLADVEPSVFRQRLKAAFAWMEEKVKEGKIRMYGTATWNGYRLRQDQPDYLSLEDLHLLAREAGGTGHHFKAVQLPVNLAMPEAWIFANQRFGAGTVPFLQLASRLGLSVMASASLLQGKLAGSLPDFMGRYAKGLTCSSQKALQFTRSVPGVTTALAGMKQKEHVEENLKTAEVPPLTEEELILMFQRNA